MHIPRADMKGAAYRYRFTSAEWNRLEQSNIWLQVTNYPTRKIVRVNIGEE